ncbi:AraC family ligand binding domain-containing protein, partial [Proteus mirabilis]|uniref:AraC family ligand binding domain-containing protein n=1 Tax=Proteus mirabilis TaxID=584 RepID=UPI0019548B56
GPVEAGAGDTITVNPGEVHDGAPIGDAGRSWRMLYFDPQVIAVATRDISQGKAGASEFSHPVIRNGDIAGRFRALFASVT